MEHAVQVIGLIVALLFAFFSIDDLFWDLASIMIKMTRGDADRIPLDRLDDVPPKLLAVMIAAWCEENVLEKVTDHMLATLHYPRDLYHVFIGVYQNDEATMGAARRLEEQYGNVHMVVNPRPGPTYKADNLNSIVRYIRRFETARKWRFCALTVHDAEDVVHPYELKLTNYLITDYDALQFPVIPLQKVPRLRRIFRGLTSGAYADEFAENHFRMMGTRDKMAAVVPSAGTGFAISHSILDSLGSGPLFPEDSLTEDYKLSLILAERGYQVHFVLEKLPRLLDDDTVRWDYIATRSFFPDTFKAAVRQKTRWIYGITMQSLSLKGILKKRNLGFYEKYSLYKDLKAKVGDVLILPGYLVFIYFVLSQLFPMPYMYPRGSPGWMLCVFLTVLMVFFQVMRAVAVANFYGFKSMAVSCLLPPILPIRLIWGNLINMAASLRAWKLYIIGGASTGKKKKIVWSKTDHAFLSRHILYRYYRNIGDVLLEKQYLSVSALKDALAQSKAEGRLLGDVLLQRKLVTEKQLISALANVRQSVPVDKLSAFDNHLIQAYDKDLLRRLQVCPLLKAGNRRLFACTSATPEEEVAKALHMDESGLCFVYTTQALVMKAIDSFGVNEQMPAYKFINGLLDKGQITLQQAAIALNRQFEADDILRYMGLNVMAEPLPDTEENAFAARA